MLQTALAAVEQELGWAQVNGCHGGQLHLHDEPQPRKERKKDVNRTVLRETRQEAIGSPIQ